MRLRRLMSTLPLLLVLPACGFFVAPVHAAEPAVVTPTIAAGQRVYSIGHSFHMFVPALLDEMAQAAEIPEHRQVGASAIGGSRVIQHWELADDKFRSKALLTAGEVDVLTMAPIFLPDEGIENFASLAVKHNPHIRITLQEFWLPFDAAPPESRRLARKKVDHNAITLEELRKRHAPYFEAMDQKVKQLNEQFGRTVVYAAPVGQAVLKLREKILAGEAPGLAEQDDLFKDDIGHPHAALKALVAYVHFGVTYRRSPVGLPSPAILAKAPASQVKLLQELAWEAVCEHPLSGVQAE
ncbi:hypothetical protein Pla8534_40250 [Lignipirellula cremea]|uniref:TraB family protein n=2 Tax=Lignipirellula cremea TaxID=2528010 RepID=A0A518DWJ0_9BACT|nr:hypothetical protein Pla8534_40250 [Lignipirellula cremea]